MVESTDNLCQHHSDNCCNIVQSLRQLAYLVSTRRHRKEINGKIVTDIPPFEFFLRSPSCLGNKEYNHLDIEYIAAEYWQQGQTERANALMSSLNRLNQQDNITAGVLQVLARLCGQAKHIRKLEPIDNSSLNG